MMAASPANTLNEKVAADNVSLITQEKTQSNVDSPIILELQSVINMERQLSTFEKVALAFLFYDDKDLSLSLCEKCIIQNNTHILMNFIQQNPAESWSMKLLECLYHVKNYFLLERYAMSKYDAERKFKSCSFILPIRLLLYKISESLTLEDSKYLIASMGSNCDPEFLEILFLKMRGLSEWMKAVDTLNELIKEPQLLKELNKVKLESLSDIRSTLPIVNKSEDTNKIEEACSYVYPIHDPNNVGLCIIINEKFKGDEERLGSENDVAALEETMKSFNFEVKTFIDVPSTFFFGAFLEFINQSFEKTHSIFFLAILSHGRQGCILCIDDKPVSIENHILKGLSLLPQLKNIPKVVIIQACQGDKYLLSNKISSDGVIACNIQSDESKRPLSDYCGNYITHAIIAMSTVPGFKSFRDTDKGTFFIQILCQCLKASPYGSFLDIITNVIKLVMEEEIKSKLKNINFCQQPECRTLLSGKLYLKRRLTSSS